MNFDRAQQLLTELQQMQQREGEIRQELSTLFASEPIPATPSTAGPKSGKVRKAKKGELTALVSGLLKGYTRPAKLDTIAKRVQAQRPGTSQASVATVLHGLVRKGAVVKPEPSTFQMLKATPAPAASSKTRKSSGPVAVERPVERVTVPVEAPAPVIEEEDKGVLIES